ncbi:MAG: ATP-binding cassette domain-containing protein [Trueperaceae bacterium]|nr:ATP-binding cassette domain-containing protein [Trueperaceae bacterium]
MITASKLSKSFAEVKALSELSFQVNSGEVYGLLGPNGAGKTTTLRILATLIEASSGTASVNGFDIKKDAEEVRKSIGVVNGGMGLYDRLTGKEVLYYFASFYGMSKAATDKRIKELDDLLDLGDTLSRRTTGFSTGMKQKIVIARAVLHDPPVIFFDEATSGLDIMARRAVMNFVKAYPSQSRAVIYSTHVMSEVEELCDRVGIIYKGKLIAEDKVEALIEQSGERNLENAFFKLIERSGSEMHT